jgi:hypothetical protein
VETTPDAATIRPDECKSRHWLNQLQAPVSREPVSVGAVYRS